MLSIALLMIACVNPRPAPCEAEDPHFYETALSRDLLLLQRQGDSARIVLDGRSILECLAPAHVRRAEPEVKARIRQMLIDAGATAAP